VRAHGDVPGEDRQRETLRHLPPPSCLGCCSLRC
jgi:hypothetical protein